MSSRGLGKKAHRTGGSLHEEECSLPHTGPWDSKPQCPHFINRKITGISPRDLEEVRCVMYVNPFNSAGNIGGIKEKKVSYDYPM